MTYIGTFEQKMISAATRNSHYGGTRPLFNSTSQRAIKVDSKTYHRLKLADSVTKAVRSVVKRGNQATDIFASRGESLRRLASLRSGVYGTHCPIRSRLVTGNCGETAGVTEEVLAAMNNKRTRDHLPTIPIVKVKWSGDHVFLTLGDPRLKSSHEVPVVDAWPNKPSAHTLDQNRTMLPGEGSNTYHSSTVRGDHTFLQKQLHRKSTEDFETKEHGGRLSSGQRAQLFYNQWLELSNKAKRGEKTNIWNQETFKISPKVQTYVSNDRHNKKHQISFDYDRRDVVKEYDYKEHQVRRAGFPDTHPDESAFPLIIPRRR